jgi:hypothetical protein
VDVLSHGPQDLLLFAGKRRQFFRQLALVGGDRLLLFITEAGEFLRTLQGPAIDDRN